MSDRASLRKDRGGFFTPPPIAQFIVDWAVQAPSDLVLEPSCGEAAFLLAVGARLRTLGTQKPGAAQLQGIEIHEESLHNAAGLLATEGLQGKLRCANFFDCNGGADLDAVVGNPPYIRYQRFTGAARTKAQEAALKQGVRLQGLANSWAAFVVQTTPESGLLLAISIKTINFVDRKSGNFQKNLTNRRGDMLFESVTLHRRFPYATLGGFLFFDKGANEDDSDKRNSTFMNAHSRLRLFTGRADQSGPDEQYEHFFIALHDANQFKPAVRFYRAGDPENEVPLSDALWSLLETVVERNTDFYELKGGKLRKA